MSISQLKLEIAEVSKQIQETEARKESLAKSLLPYIDSYFTARVQQEQDAEKRRDYAHFNASKKFDIIDGTILHFSASNRSGPISCYVKIVDIVGE